MSIEIHEGEMPAGVLGRCEVCDKTVDGAAFEHLADAHPDEMFEMWADPESGTWTVIEKSTRFGFLFGDDG